ncbi:MAG TPA: hypothetical protein VM286_10760 [Candidatus Thermoplasmatota archaeon]|nr:hypothetical protein [Candidatus Thermoplasmatota archaeon]
MMVDGWQGDRDADGDPCGRPVRSAYYNFIKDLTRRTGALHAWGWRVDVDETYIHAVAGHKLPAGMSVRVLNRSSPSVVVDCMRERKPVHADQPTAERRYPMTAAFMQQLGARSTVAAPVRGDRLMGIVSLGMAEPQPPRDLMAELEARCTEWIPQAVAAEQEEHLLETEAWRAATNAARESVDAGLAQAVKVLADAARYIPRRASERIHQRIGHNLELPAPRDGLEPHRQAHLPGDTARAATVQAAPPPPALHSMMDVPVLQGGVLLGHVQFARSTMRGCFTTRHLEWAQEFARAVAVSPQLPR